MKDDDATHEHSTGKPDEEAVPYENSPHDDEPESYTVRCTCCCKFVCLPDGLLHWALATVMTIVALAIAGTAVGSCHFLKVKIPAQNVTHGVGFNRYDLEHNDSCELWNEGDDKGLFYSGNYWEVAQYFVDIALIVMLLFTVLILSTGCLEYKCAGRTFFAKVAVAMAVTNTLFMASFLVFASDICMDEGHKCFLDFGSFLMMAAIAAWWIAGWLVLNIIPLGQEPRSDDQEPLTSSVHHSPSRWRSLYGEICLASLVAAAATNGAIIAIERRD